MTDHTDFTPPPLPGGLPSSGGDDDASSASQPDPKGRRPRRKRRGSTGRWVFITMAAAMVLIAGGIGWATVVDIRADAVTASDADATGMLHTGQVVSGMCIKTAPNLDQQPGAVHVVDCASPHHAEALVDYAFTSDEWPGEAAATQQVIDFCRVQVDPLTGSVPRVPDAPEFDWHVWVPTAATWEIGDRTAICVATTDRPVAGSFARGTAHDAAKDAVVG